MKRANARVLSVLIAAAVSGSVFIYRKKMVRR